MKLIASVKSWLKPPVYPDDEKSRQAVVLYTLTATILAGLVSILSTNLFTAWSLMINIVLVMAICLMVSNIFLVRRGNLTAPAWLIPLSLIVILTFMFYVGEGIYDILVVSYLTVLIIASLLLGKRGAIIFGGIILVAMGWLISAEILGIIDPQPVKTSYDFLFLIGPTVAIAAYALYFLMNTFERNLQKSRQNKQALIESNRELLALRSSLEAQVTERTHKAEAATVSLQENVWLVTGQNQLNAALRGESDVTRLAQKIMKQLCGYLNASVGVLYVLSADLLTLAGGYACAPRQPQSFQLGEGLVGQVAQTKRPLSRFPDSDATILLASGLGNRQPDFVIALPIVYETALLGVVVLGHWQQLTPLQTRFLTDSLPSVAVALRSAQTWIQLAELQMTRAREATPT